MRIRTVFQSSILLVFPLLAGCVSTAPSPSTQNCPLKLDGLFYETAAGRTRLPAIPFLKLTEGLGSEATTNLPDGRTVVVTITPAGNDFMLRLSARPDRTL